MSSTNRGAVRKESDNYPTPIETAKTFWKHYRPDCFAIFPSPIEILEPCCGSGNILNAFDKVYPDLSLMTNKTLVDIRQEVFSQVVFLGNTIINDFLTFKAIKEYDLIITNPPYSIAQEVIEKCFEIASERTEIIMLLRLGFLESKKRRIFWDKHPLTELYICGERPSFTNGGNDSTAYGWFVWKNSESKGIKTIY